MKPTRRNLVNKAKEKCSHQEKQWRAMVVATGSICLKCRKHGYMTRDHVIPVALGGDNGIYNIQPLCYGCNTEKNARKKDYRTKRDMGKIMHALYKTDCCGHNFDISSVYTAAQCFDEAISHTSPPPQQIHLCHSHPAAHWHDHLSLSSEHLRPASLPPQASPPCRSPLDPSHELGWIRRTAEGHGETA